MSKRGTGHSHYIRAVWNEENIKDAVRLSSPTFSNMQTLSIVVTCTFSFLIVLTQFGDFSIQCCREYQAAKADPRNIFKFPLGLYFCVLLGALICTTGLTGYIVRQRNEPQAVWMPVLVALCCLSALGFSTQVSLLQAQFHLTILDTR